MLWSIPGRKPARGAVEVLDQQAADQSVPAFSGLPIFAELVLLSFPRLITRWAKPRVREPGALELLAQQNEKTISVRR